MKRFYYCGNAYKWMNKEESFDVNFPDYIVRFRLNIIHANKTFYIPMNGKLCACKIMYAYLIKNGVKLDSIQQRLVLSVARHGTKHIDYATYSGSKYDVRYRNYNAYIYSSVDNFKKKIHTDPFVKEQAQEFFESIFGNVEWNYKPGHSIGDACKYHWSGTSVEEELVTMPVENVSYLPDGTISFGGDAKKYVEYMRKCFATKQECYEYGINNIDIIEFENDAKSNTSANKDENIVAKITEWVAQQNITIGELNEILNKLK